MLTREEKISELRERVQRKLKRQCEDRLKNSFIPEIVYDEVYFEGVEWLNSLEEGRLQGMLRGLEMRHCCICGDDYKYAEEDRSDLRCCSKECEVKLLDEMAKEEGE